VTIESKGKIKRVIFNALYLLALQGSNYILPLIILPYLLRVIGIELYGVIAFATVVINYFNVLVDYGFNLSATKDLSLLYADKKWDKINELFSAVMLIKFGMTVLAGIVLLILMEVFTDVFYDKKIYLYSFGIVLGQSLFPIWFFQGIEKMKFITYFNIFSKVVFVLGVFCFVKEKNDYYIVQLLNSVSGVVSGLLSVYFVFHFFGVRVRIITLRVVKKYLIDGWYVFVSRLYGMLYSNTNVFLLGVFAGTASVGYYNIIEKIVLAFAGIFEPVNQAVYPYMVSLYKKGYMAFFDFYRKISYVYIAMSFCLFIFVYLFKDLIVTIVMGEVDSIVVSLLSIFIIRIFFFPFGSLFANVLIIMQNNKVLIQGMKYGAILNLIIVVPLIYFNGLYGMVLSVLFVYSFIVVFYYVNIRKITSVRV